MTDAQKNKMDTLSKHRHAIEALARENDVPLEQVEELYRIEIVKLERVARIKNYVPVLASRSVKAQLRAENNDGDEPEAATGS
jgi:Protein of unknown function (DUF3562)